MPLTEAAIAAIHELPPPEECPYVFYDPATGERPKECRKAWEPAREKAGVPELQVKDLRRDYAIRLAEAGADMHDIQQVLGHSSVATTDEGKASQAKTA
ncbi:MAG: tyrosine-type recombinase/integrase [Acidobacteriota bacterium]